jgi:hypothetical protein
LQQYSPSRAKKYEPIDAAQGSMKLSPARHRDKGERGKRKEKGKGEKEKRKGNQKKGKEILGRTDSLLWCLHAPR